MYVQQQRLWIHKINATYRIAQRIHKAEESEHGCLFSVNWHVCIENPPTTRMRVSQADRAPCRTPSLPADTGLVSGALGARRAE